MRDSLIIKARKLLPLVKLEGETKNRLFFSIELDEPVKVDYIIDENGVTYLNCTCAHISIYQGVRPEAMCSHKLAVISYMVQGIDKDVKN